VLRDLRASCVTNAARDGQVTIALRVSILAFLSLLRHLAICSDGCLYGTCAVPGICTCNEGYSGAICTERMPSSHSVSHTTAVCSSCVNGECTAPGVCTCNEGWSGSGCAQGCFLWIYSLLNHSAICTEGCTYGDCKVPATCDCYAGWEGPTCKSPACLPKCKNGRCIRTMSYNASRMVFTHECQCQIGWTGIDCGTRKEASNHGLFSHYPAICREGCLGGSCSVPNTCDCFENWKGDVCNTCNEGWSGSQCSTGTFRSLYRFITFHSYLRNWM
jgi:hypothetical protein